MKITFLAATASVVLPFCVTTAIAGEFTGGSVGLGYSAFTEDAGGTIDKTALSGSLEYGFDRNAAVQGDLALSKLGGSDNEAVNVTLHGIFHLDEKTSFGGFIAREEVDSEGLTLYGLEAGHDAGQFEGETYIAYGESNDEDTVLFGLSGLYNVNDAFGFGAKYDRIDIDSLVLNRVAVEAEYRVQNVILSAELGQLDLDGADSETFFGIGARVAFGAKRGATFDRRGLIEALPGL